MPREFGSGTGQSYDADFLKCRRYFYWRHHEGVELREKGDGAPLIVGHAGHAWMEAFYSALGNTDLTADDCYRAVEFADDIYAGELTKACEAATGLGFKIMEVEKKSQTALQLLHVLWPKFAARVKAGERTLATELHGTLTLPDHMREQALRNFTAQLDRVFYHPGDEEQPLAGVALDEYKFTGMASPAMYAENQLLNDQSLGYLYFLKHALTSEPGFAFDYRAQPVIGVRYRVFRVDGGITPKSYAEVWETVSPAKLQDWYVRKCALRAEMSQLWEKPLDAWTAARYSFGPCHSYGRECVYWQMCDEPGEERHKIGSSEDANSPYVFAAEESKP